MGQAKEFCERLVHSATSHGSLPNTLLTPLQKKKRKKELNTLTERLYEILDTPIRKHVSQSSSYLI